MENTTTLFEKPISAGEAALEKGLGFVTSDVFEGVKYAHAAIETLLANQIAHGAEAPPEIEAQKERCHAFFETLRRHGYTH